jgi:FtsP/CotA-like multicopper oxidase with cupredoxin domain
MTVTRRAFLSAAGAGALGWALTGHSAAEVEPHSAAAVVPRASALPPPGQPLPVLPEMPLIPAADGHPTAAIIAAPLPVDPAGPSSLVYAPPLAYNGGIPGPILRLRDGQGARVRFVNQSQAMTNLHLHGLHIAPSVDAPFTHIHPGHRRDYEFTLPRGRAATYWYHPHVHGQVEEQMLHGLYGPLLVDPAVLPAQLAGSQEQVLVLSTRLDDHQVLVNGAQSPTLAATSTRVRFRIINAAVMRTMTLQLRETSGPGAGRARPFWLVATDAGFIGSPLKLTKLTLAPAERAEILLDVGTAPAALVTTDDGATLLTVTGPDAPAFPAPARRLATLTRLTPAKHATHRIIKLTQSSDGDYTLDNKSFDERRIDQKVGHNAVEIWDIRNTTSMAHPFHLHTWPVQILSRNGHREKLLAWRDVVLVPAHQSVQLAVKFDNFRGTTVYHCHIAAHEDAGMMGTVKVV